MAKSRGNSSVISASARIFLATEIVLRLVPCYTRIELLIVAKFLRTVKELSESFITTGRNFIVSVSTEIIK